MGRRRRGRMMRHVRKEIELSRTEDEEQGRVTTLMKTTETKMSKIEESTTSPSSCVSQRHITESEKVPQSEVDDSISTRSVEPDKSTNTGAESDKESSAGKQFELAAAELRANPSIMTPGLLCLALHNRPPLHIIKFMLRVNPRAADVPETGQSALQVAVKNNASLEVVEEVIRACPQALFEGNGTYDPPTYAKIWRREDEQLLELLSKPSSAWAAAPATKHTAQNGAIANRSSPVSRERISTVEQEELKNIKRIAAFIIKTQKRQTEKDKRSKKKLQEELNAFEAREASARRDQVDTLIKSVADICAAASEKQDDHTRRLLDIQEETSRVWVEARLAAVKTDLIDSAETATEYCQARMTEISNRLEREVDRNAAFRRETSRKLRSIEKRIDVTMNAQVALQKRRESQNPSIPNKSSHRKSMFPLRRKNKSSSEKAGAGRKGSRTTGQSPKRQGFARL